MQMRPQAVTTRTFARRFREQTGTTPLQRLLAVRVRRAQELLEIGSCTIGEVATASGFEAMVTFRNRFQQIVGVGPAAYRRRFAGDRGNRSWRSPHKPNAMRWTFSFQVKALVCSQTTSASWPGRKNTWPAARGSGDARRVSVSWCKWLE